MKEGHELVLGLIRRELPNMVKTKDKIRPLIFEFPFWMANNRNTRFRKVGFYSFYSKEHTFRFHPEAFIMLSDLCIDLNIISDEERMKIVELLKVDEISFEFQYETAHRAAQIVMYPSDHLENSCI